MARLKNFSENELKHFEALQTLAYQCAQAVREKLYAGITEKEAALMMREWMAERGVSSFFHKPFAWFGERSTLKNFGNLDFFPKNNILENNMAVILDIAPLKEGYSADIGYSFIFGEEDESYTKMLKDLLSYRSLILQGVKQGKTFATIYRELDSQIQIDGYENSHARYPERVLAHRLSKVKQTALSRFHFLGFGLNGYFWLINQAIFAKTLTLFGFARSSRSPLWNKGDESNHKPTEGLWAVEPHIGKNKYGAKWEEILVITKGDAFWLSDQVPHVLEGRARGWI